MLSKNVIAERPKITEIDVSELFTQKLLNALRTPISKHSNIDHSDMYKFGNPLEVTKEERKELWKKGIVV